MNCPGNSHYGVTGKKPFYYLTSPDQISLWKVFKYNIYPSKNSIQWCQENVFMESQLLTI